MARSARTSLVLLVGLMALQLAGVALFLRGFLHTRHVLTNVTMEEAPTPPARVVLLVIDALRFDFAKSVDGPRFSRDNPSRC